MALTMTKRGFRGFLTPLEKKYLQFLEYEIRNHIEYQNRMDWNKSEKMPHRSLDFQIRWKTREALKDLRLVFKKFGFFELRQLFDDPEVMDNLSFLNETVKSVEARIEEIRKSRE